MAEQERTDHTGSESGEERAKSGQPGGRQGRVDEVGHTGIYPGPGPTPAGDADIRFAAAWGQGERGAAGYEDSGVSEISTIAGQPGIIGATTPGIEAQPPPQPTAGEQPAGLLEQEHRRYCRDIMTSNPVCCMSGDTVDRAAQIMKEHDVGAVPVIDSSKKLLGIVTDRDLTLRILAEGRDPGSTRVEEVMTRNLTVCRPDDEIQRVMGEMAAHQVRRIPVIDDDACIVGIIAQADIATRAREPERTALVVDAISRPTSS